MAAKKEQKTTKDGIDVHCSFNRMIKVEDLKPNPKNPNTHPEAQLQLLEKVIVTGWRHPIVVSNLSGMIVAGHGRLEAAKRCGLTEVPVDFQDFENPEAEQAHLLADNRLPELASMDKGLLKDLLQEIDTGALTDMEVTGYSMTDLERMMTAAPPPPPPEGVDAESDLPTATVRVVQLFMNEGNIDAFNAKLDALARMYSTDNITDTIVAAVDSAAEAAGFEE